MKSGKQISVIIPTLNEAGQITRLLTYLHQIRSPEILEVIISDGGSTDSTIPEALAAGAEVVHALPGRASQLNAGARKARGHILYFLHADTFPPPGYGRMILQVCRDRCQAGCFSMRFDSESRFLGFFSWFTRFNVPVCRGGDQSLFVTRSLFQKAGGFNEVYRVYEDNEFTSRLYRLTNFVVIRTPVISSARRYRKKNMLALQYHFGIIHLKNYLGHGPDSLFRYYRRKIA